jgi:hypothetical protein
MRRSRVLPEVLALDPVRDHQRIARLSAGVDFPWDTRRAYELALIKTFADPQAARLLVGTGAFLERTAERYDATLVGIATLGLEGYDSPAGRAALSAMNRAHRAHRIAADAYRYTLSLFVLEPLRWNARFGWRPLHPIERQAGFHFWREVGRRMAIPELPPDLDAMERESLAYEERHVRYDPANRRLLDATVALVARRSAPWAARPLGALSMRALSVLLDDRSREAFALPAPSPATRRAVEWTLRGRAATLRALPPRRRVVAVPVPPTRRRAADGSAGRGAGGGAA